MRINNAEDAFLLPSRTVYKARGTRKDLFSFLVSLSLFKKDFPQISIIRERWKDEIRHIGKTGEQKEISQVTRTQFTSLISRELCGKFLFDKLSTKV
jgi:hypothetical protein